ncbi:MAG: hypothetical protein IIA92_06355 [Chloroflexi bacterium]|nr:hypothetical protein [Chloroflexota bacterium]
MLKLTKKDEARMVRYRGQSLRLLRDAMDEIRGGRWGRCEELLWGSLTLAVKGVALGRGRELDGLKAVEDYAHELGQENRDRRIREAFTKLASFGDTAERVRESRIRADHLVATLEDVTGAVERLWDLAPGGDLPPEPVPVELQEPEEPDELEEMDNGSGGTD